MNNKIPYQESKENGMPGLIPREVWLPEAVEYLARLQEGWGEKWDIAAVQTHDPDLWEQIVEKLRELDQLGPATGEALLAILRQIDGLFEQAFWRRNGYDTSKLALGSDGRVLAVRLPVPQGRPHLQRFVGAWATAEPSFQSPDGEMVFQIEEVEKLLVSTETEVEQFFQSRLH